MAARYQIPFQMLFSFNSVNTSVFELDISTAIPGIDEDSESLNCAVRDLRPSN